MGFVIGVDIGQKRDPTAICVAEAEDRCAQQRPEQHYVIRHLERLPLGTAYPEVAERVGEVTQRIAQKLEGELTLYVDATGVGKPIVDILREKLPEDQRVVAVYFTKGDRRTEEPSEVKLGKAYLVSRLQVLLQSRRLHLPQTAEAKALRQELLDYEIRVDEHANDRYGAFRVGAHDDLVTALGLAVQTDVDLDRDFGW